MEGLCVPGVSWAVVAILYLSRRCDVWMYRYCAGVARGLPLRGRSAARPVSLCHCLKRLTVRTLQVIALVTSEVLIAACLRHIHTDEQGPWVSLSFFPQT